MANGKVHRCVICGIKPSPIGQYCHKCTQAVDKIKREAKSGRVDRFITYQDNVIGLIPKGNGQFIATVLKRDAAKLPASKTLDLIGLQFGVSYRLMPEHNLSGADYVAEKLMISVYDARVLLWIWSNIIMAGIKEWSDDLKTSFDRHMERGYYGSL